MRYGYMCKEYMQAATSFERMLRIRSIDLKMGAMPKKRPQKAFLLPDGGQRRMARYHGGAPREPGSQKPTKRCN
jgi:hypothetical protein